MVRGYMRIGLALAAVVGALALATPSYAATDQTYATGDHGYSVVIGYIDHVSAFDLAPLVLVDVRARHLARAYQAFKSFAVKQRSSGAAVRPTSIAGWGSGRVRRLAG